MRCYKQYFDAVDCGQSPLGSKDHLLNDFIRKIITEHEERIRSFVKVYANIYGYFELEGEPQSFRDVSDNLRNCLKILVKPLSSMYKYSSGIFGIDAMPLLNAMIPDHDSYTELIKHYNDILHLVEIIYIHCLMDKEVKSRAHLDLINACILSEIITGFILLNEFDCPDYYYEMDELDDCYLICQKKDDHINKLVNLSTSNF